MTAIFTQSAFIRMNTPEIRERVEELGYKKFFTFDFADGCIGTFFHPVYRRVYSSYSAVLIDIGYRDDAIDCGTNINLFLSLAALRSDCDYMQWFTDGEGWLRCEGIDLLKEDYTPSMLFEFRDFWHKATPAELVEHFKAAGQ